jgi:16S rRNA (guanine527-N7)-methyltransferase
MRTSPSAFAAAWRAVASEAPFAVEAGLAAPFSTYRNELAAFNAAINLIRYRDERELAARHFLDSMAGASFVPEGAAIADLGSGAGFPGAVLAIARPDLRVTLVESVGKKANFLRGLRRSLDASFEVVEDRWEALDLRRFDMLVTRAAANPEALIASLRGRYAGPVLLWIAPSDATADMTTLVEYRLPGDDRARCVARAVLN